MAGGGGGAWKVAYADFVTAMMAFFLVMWIVAQNKPVKEAVAMYFNDPYGTMNKPSKASSLMMMPSGGVPNIKAPLIGKVKSAAGKASADPGAKPAEEADQRSRSPGKAGMPSSGEGVRTVGSLVRFDDDSAGLNENAQQTLDELLPDLQGKSFRIEVRGHASGRPLGSNSSFSDPWALCYARSMAAMKYLVEHGISPKRIRLSQAGANEQNSEGQDSDGLRKQNSRVEIYALNELVYDAGTAREPLEKGPKKPGLKKAARPKSEAETAK
jgi:chemotaxis protein MotB